MNCKPERSFFEDRFFGFVAAMMHFAGALKSVIFLRDFPIDVTIVSFALCLVILALRFQIFIKNVSISASFYFLCLSLFCCYFLILATWTNMQSAGYQKLFDIIVLAPLITILAVSVGSNANAFDGFCKAVVIISIFVFIASLGTLLLGYAKIGGSIDNNTVRIQYQLVGLLFASGAVISASSFANEFPKKAVRHISVFFVFLLGNFFTGGRASLAAALVGTLLSIVVLTVIQSQYRLKIYFLLVLVSSMCALSLLVFSHIFGIDFFGLRRVIEKGGIDFGVRAALWEIALSKASVSGIGVAAFAAVAGLGDLRKWYVHHLWLESLVEGGIFGFVVFSLMIVTAICSFVQGFRIIPVKQYAIVGGFMVIGFVQMFTSTDLGNRMGWFWLGLLTGFSCRNGF